MCWSVYVIQSEIDGRLYKGMTQDVSKRIRMHNMGKVRSTKAYRPWRLFFEEQCEDSLQARAREIFLKTNLSKDTTDQGSGFLACASRESLRVHEKS